MWGVGGLIISLVTLHLWWSWFAGWWVIRGYGSKIKRANCLLPVCKNFLLYSTTTTNWPLNRPNQGGGGSTRKSLQRRISNLFNSKKNVCPMTYTNPNLHPYPSSPLPYLISHSPCHDHFRLPVLHSNYFVTYLAFSVPLLRRLLPR